MTPTPTLCPQIREAVLRDPRYPVHKIADQLLPYLEVLVEQFHPEQVILFGSYAYGEPNRDSDVDLLVVIKEMQAPFMEVALAIRKAWRAVRRSGESLPIDILLETPETHKVRVRDAAGFYDQINSLGLRLA
jgi:predicted nucleotidyltransferase